MKLSSIITWPYWHWRTPWPDHVHQFDYLDWETQRNLAYAQIDKGKFGHWTVFVAGIGFLTDAYDIFAVNTVVPMISQVYWDGEMPQRVSVLISLSLLVGSVVGQLLFGILGDRLGRRKCYGIELVILTIATILVSVASKGALQSTNKTAWIVAWRFIMGIGIGGDYPLSAVIVSEFAPRKHRGRMLSTLFFMQASGQLLGNLVSIIAITIASNSVNFDISTCDEPCKDAVDNLWRWIVGLGAVPPFLAILFRWWIPESPRYTMEVEKNPAQARKDVERYFPLERGLLDMPTESIGLKRHQSQQADANERINHTPTSIAAELTQEDSAASPSHQIPPLPSGFENHDEQPQIVFGENVSSKNGNHLTQTTPTNNLGTFQQSEMKNTDNSNTINPLPIPKLHGAENTLVRKETNKEFFQSFYIYLSTQGNYTDLLGTSITWLLLDFAYYFLSVNNPRILTKLWHTENKLMTIYNQLLANGYRALIAVSIGAIMGGAIFIAMARSRWKLQVYGFWMLAGAFVVVGICFVVLLGTRYFAAVIVLYAACSFFFNLGPNTSTYVIPAEVFPTKFRSSCHGISAAAGKAGSIFAQIFLAYVKFGDKSVNDANSTWLGWVLLVFAAVMLLGALVTHLWVPNPVDVFGHSRSLEQLALGKATRRRLESEELALWRSLAPRCSDALSVSRSNV